MAKTKSEPLNTLPTQIATAVKAKRPLPTRLLLLAACLVSLAVVVGCISLYYRDRALPNVSLGKVDVSGRTKEEIRQIALAQKQAIALTFEYNGKKVEAGLEDVGVNIDIDASVDQALTARRGWWDVLFPWSKQTVPLAYTTDLGVAKLFAGTHFPDVVIDAKDAEIKFNEQTKSYEIIPGAAGTGFDALAFVKAVENLAVNPSPVTLQVTTAAVQPVVQADKLESVKEQSNKTKDLQFRFVYQGKVRYAAEPADIASWTHFSPNPNNSSLVISYDTAKIEQFLREKVGSAIAAPPQDRKIIVDSKTGEEIVIQAGREGSELANIEELGKEILNALQNQQSLEKEVAITTAPFKTVTMKGADRWVEVDLSEQRTYLWLGNERIASFLISSGIAKYPTVTGEFAVRYKTPKQTMTGGSRATGDYYSTPNVRWVSYFYGDYALHGAWWHNNFGQPMSHGCINMRDEDAKIVYDFAPVGTKVIVHH